MRAILLAYASDKTTLNTEDFHDFFIAFVPNKWISITAAYAYLGQIADKLDQEAIYVSVQVAF